MIARIVTWAVEKRWLVLLLTVIVAAIEIGSRVIGAGVGREVYVNGKDVAARTLTLSQPLHGAGEHRDLRDRQARGGERGGRRRGSLRDQRHRPAGAGRSPQDAAEAGRAGQAVSATRA